MKYYSIVLYSTHAVQRINGIAEAEAMRFKKWLLSDTATPYEMNFKSSLYKSGTESTVIFKNNLLNVDFDIWEG